VDDLKARYRAGKVGDVEVKTKLANALNAHLDPIRERRAAVLAAPFEPSDARSAVRAGLAALRGLRQPVESGGLGVAQRQAAEIEHAQQRQHRSRFSS